MGKSYCSLGSTARSKILEKWKKTVWTVELHEGEVIPSNKKRKSGNENEIIQAKKLKVAKDTEDLKIANKKLKEISKEYESLKKSCKVLSTALKNVTNESIVPSHTRAKKAWELCTKQYQNKRAQEMAQNINTALSFTENEIFKPVRVEILNKSTGNIIICNNDDGKLKVTKDNKQCFHTNETIVDQTLYIKDKFNISNQAYHEMSMVNKELPRSCTLLKTAKNIDAQCIIRSTPGQLKGVQVSLKEKLQQRIKYLAENYLKYRTSQCVKIKLTGDGTNVSRSVNLVVIAFTIIDSETDHVTSPNSPTGNCILALINTTEGYDNLSEALEDIIDEVNNLQSVIVNGVSYDLQYFFGADMKFLAICMGIEAANSNFSCIWCKCPTSDRYDISKSWSVTNTNEGARTIGEIQKLAVLKKNKTNKKYGCIRQPLFTSIPVYKVIPDVLHLFLRITDVLINLLILELRRLDGIQKSQLQSFNKSATINITNYEKILNETCKISFHMYVDKDSKALKWRDLTGPEKLKLFNHIDIPKLFPDVTHATQVQKIWKDFLSIYSTLCLQSVDKESVEKFKTTVKDWLSCFLSVYQTKNVTPYMHTLIFHIPEFLNLYGSLVQFSQQGLEKLNDTLTKDYFRSSNHHDEFLRQLMLKRNRLEALEMRNIDRPKQIHHCTKCNGTDHNSRTCKRL